MIRDADTSSNQISCRWKVSRTIPKFLARIGPRKPAGLLLLILLLLLVLAQSPHFFVKSNPLPIRVPQDYLTIQEAVNAALPGDTILVSPSPTGTYAGNITVMKSLNLTGVSVDTVIIDSAGATSAITVNSTSSVFISQFTLRNIGFGSGVEVSESTGVVVSQNRIQAGVPSNSQGNGVTITNSTGVVVRNNTLTNNVYGVAVVDGYGNLITRNNVTGNSIGVSIFNSTGNKVTDNILRKGWVGLELQTGADTNIIARNLIANNTSYGLLLRSTTGNRVTENTVEYNNALSSTEGILVQGGASLNRLYHNNIRANSIQAFSVFPPGDMNTWDNATGTSLKSDARIKFVNSNSDNAWSFNETVVYDTNDNGTYDPGELLIGMVNGTMMGTPPVPGTLVKLDMKIRFIDSNNNGSWNTGEAVAYDTNNDSVYLAGEPEIAGVGGNYWGDYQGKDNGANGFAGDGIGDTALPHPCPTGGQPCSGAGGPPGFDWYPLTRVWVPLLNVTVTVTASPQVVFESSPVSFSGSASGGLAPYSFSWNFEDGTATSQAQNTTHVYSVKGNYVATLTVADSSAITGSDSIVIIVRARVGNLVVHVLDPSQKPVASANVTSLSTPSGQARITQRTNNFGIAAFLNLVPGTYMIQASSPGYRDVRKNVTVNFNQTVNENLVLTLPPPTLDLTPYLWAGAGIAAVILGGLGYFLWKRKGKKGAGKTENRAFSSRVKKE